jgi:tetratricopeptide (TPR) repeat protein
VAEAVETLHPGQLEPHALALGLHFEEAGVWAKAVSYLRRAGTQALARAGYREAALSFARALAALEHLPGAERTLDAVDLRRELNEALVPLGEYRQALDHLREAERLALALDDRARLARILSEICARLRNIGEHDGAVDAGRRAAAMAASLADDGLEGRIAFRRGQAHLAAGELDQAARLLRSSLEVERAEAPRCRPAGNPVWARAWLVRALTGLGAFEEGIDRGEEALRQAESDDDPYALTLVQAFLGQLLVTRGDLQRAIPLLERALALAREADIPDAFSSAALGLGQAYVLGGRVQEGLPLLERVVEDDVRRGVPHASCVVHLGEGYLRANRLEEALDRATWAAELARTHRERAGGAWAARLAGEILVSSSPPDLDGAEASYRQALGTALELGMRPLVAHCHLGLGRLDGRRGLHGKDEPHLEIATRLLAEMRMALWLPRPGTPPVVS